MTNPTSSNEERERLLNQCSVQASELLNTFNKIHSIKIGGHLAFHMPVDDKLKDISCNTQRALKNFDNRQLEKLHSYLDISNSILIETIQTLSELDGIIKKADTNIFQIGSKIMTMETKEASIAEDIHNAISTIKSFIQRIIDFLSSKIRIIGGKQHSSNKTNSHSFFPANSDSEGDTAMPPHCSTILNAA